MAIPAGFSNGVHAEASRTDSTKPIEEVDLVIIGGEHILSPSLCKH